ncbi:MAG: hypothetical protein QM493_03580 [Sulfurovum sp.]
MKKEINFTSFQGWIDNYGYNDVRFYPRNTDAFGKIDMEESAYRAVLAYESGQSTKYTDNVESYIEPTSKNFISIE